MGSSEKRKMQDDGICNQNSSAGNLIKTNAKKINIVCRQ